MATIRQAERATYEEMFAVEHYSTFSPGEYWLKAFLSMAQPTMRGSLLDAGTGCGKGALALEKLEFVVQCCDIADNRIPEAAHLPFTEICLWDNIKRKVGFVDWVYCCDVLEHIPPVFTMLVVSRLLEVARRGVFISVALAPDSLGIWIGKPLHQTVQSFTDWRDQLQEIGEVVESRDCMHNGLFVLKP